MGRSLSRGRKLRPKKLAFARELRRKQTWEEAALWESLRGSRLAGWKFRRQQLMHGYIADFYCEEGNLCVEVDGPVHEERDQAEWDRVRDEAVAKRGIQVLRIKFGRIFSELDKVLEEILQRLGGANPKRGPRS